MGYIANVGVKASAVVTVKFIGSYEVSSYGYYGNYRNGCGYGHGTNLMYAYVMETENGDQIVWKTTSSMSVVENDEYYFIKKGDKIFVEGTVKNCSEYKGVEQTVLTRCKYRLLEKGPSEEEIIEAKRAEQIANLGERTTKRVTYKEYKNDYSDKETLAGSFERTDYGCYITIIL